MGFKVSSKTADKLEQVIKDYHKYPKTIDPTRTRFNPSDNYSQYLKVTDWLFKTPNLFTGTALLWDTETMAWEEYDDVVVMGANKGILTQEGYYFGTRYGDLLGGVFGSDDPSALYIVANDTEGLVKYPCVSDPWELYDLDQNASGLFPTVTEINGTTPICGNFYRAWMTTNPLEWFIDCRAAVVGCSGGSPVTGGV